MRFTYKTAELLTKGLFSLVILHLTFIVFSSEAGVLLASDVMEALEHSAAGAMCALGGGLLLNYILKTNDQS